MTNTMYGTFGRIAGTKTGTALISAWVVTLALMIVL